MMRPYVTPVDRRLMGRNIEYLRLMLMWQEDYWVATFYDRHSQATDRRHFVSGLRQGQTRVIDEFVADGWQATHTQLSDGCTVVYLERVRHGQRPRVAIG